MLKQKKDIKNILCQKKKNQLKTHISKLLCVFN